MVTLHEAMEHAARCEVEGRLERAEQIYRRILHDAPHLIEPWQRLAALLHRERRLAEAIDCQQRLVELNPDSAAAHNNLGAVLLDQGSLDAATASFQHAVRLKPDLAEAHSNLADALARQGQPVAAEAEYLEAIRLQPHLVGAHYNLGVLLQAADRWDESIASYQRTIAAQPDHVEALTNLGVTLIECLRLCEAADCFERALRLRPGDPTALESRGIVRLKRGDYTNGWPDMEARWQRKGLKARVWNRPEWQGEDVAGRAVLAYAEQGLGDTLQFVRYARLLRERGARTVVECQAPLALLLSGCPGVDQVVAQGSPLPDYDFQIPLVSLPRVFQSTLDNVPSEPYLAPQPDLAAHWRQELQTLGGFRIGIAWQGNPSYRYDKWRSIPLREFQPLAEVANARLVSLQKGAGSEQLAALGGAFPVLDLAARLDETTGPFLDTAAAMTVLDLVVTSDSAVAHLAGALGVPVWLALPHASDWRWLLDRYDSPWYPSMRLFRQHRPGDWASVFRRMATALRKHASRRVSASYIS